MLRDNRFKEALGLKVPLVCGAMYPCSNPELVAAVSEAGGIGIIQPLSLTFVHGHEFAAGLALIRQRTSRPVGFNVIVEQSNKTYQDRMRRYVDLALEHGIRFFITSLGNPNWVVERVHREGGLVYHDVTDARWAKKAIDHGVDGLIGVNNAAGGHAGHLGPEALFDALAPLGKPVLCAGGIGNPTGFAAMIELGYAGVQMGTRFIASEECRAHPDYKAAIVKARAQDIVLTERISGVPVAVIKTPYVEAIGTRAGPIARMMLKGRKTKHWMRNFYTMLSVWRLKRGLSKPTGSRDYWQAGQSVEGIDAVEPVSAIVANMAAAIEPAAPTR